MEITFDWRLSRGIASASNFAMLLVVLLSLPVVLWWTGTFSFADIDPLSRQHLEAFVKSDSHKCDGKTDPQKR
jgi:hypothetical protein